MSDNHSANSSKATYPLNKAFSLLNNLTLNHINSKGKCGGKAVCGGCRIQISSMSDQCNQVSAEEKCFFTQQERLQGWRLACQTYCLRNVSFFKPD